MGVSTVGLVSADERPLGASLRERKRERTRRALVDAAIELFECDGYEQTTIAAIAAHAEVGTRTFFSYFASKEEVLFPDINTRVQLVGEAIATRSECERPVDVLLRALASVAGTETDVVSRLASVRMRLLQTVPALRGRALQLQFEAGRDIAARLHEAFPEELDQVHAAALVGAFIGAITGALQLLLDPSATSDQEQPKLDERLREATEIALRAWRH